MPTYTLQKGDNLSSLARKFGTTVNAIMQANVGNSAIKSRNLIIAGRNINIPTTPVTPTAPARVLPPTPTPTPTPIPTPTPTPTPTAPSITGNDQLDEILSLMRQQLVETQRRGEVVNPRAEITPQRTAEFLLQAQQEIDPFYRSQLRMATEGFMSSIGFTRDQILQFEEDLTRKFQKGFRELGESAAERGFALSGIRQREERELAEEVQREAERARQKTSFETQTRARELAAEFGPEAVSPFTLPELPRFTPTGLVERGQRELPAFELGSAFTGLTGRREFERRAATRTRQAELEEAERQRLLAQQVRTLNL